MSITVSLSCMRFPVTGLPSSRRRRESLPIVANGVYGARDMDNIVPLSSPKAINDGTWTRAEPTPELPPQKKRRGLFGKKSSGEQQHQPDGAEDFQQCCFETGAALRSTCK